MTAATAISTGGPHGQSTPGQLAGVQLVSSFGVGNTTLGAPGCDGLSFIGSARSMMLARRESYYKCTHHDHKVFDFDGRMIPPGPPITQPFLSTSEQFSTFVPLRSRRPAATYRLARIITGAFTSLLFGRGRWPTIKVHGDSQTEDFTRALVKAASLRTVMIRARNVGGSVGTVGLSWRFHNGHPFVKVHSGKRLLVRSWADEGELVPEHVSEIYTYSEEVWDAGKCAHVPKWFWYRYDWTPVADVAFCKCEFKSKERPIWKIDEQHSHFHNHGRCHFVWVRNLPEDDDAGGIDGQPDYAELYESLESLDILKSVIVRGATLNLDPTVVLKLDPDIMQRMGVKKGSDNALVVGLQGDARYMELSGTSISAGTDLFVKLRDAILEAAQCVVPDPNEVAGAGTSAVALKVVYEPMLAKGDILREQYGQAIERLLEQMISYCQAVLEPRVEMIVELVVDDETGIETQMEIEEEVQSVAELPPRYVTRAEIDSITGEEIEVVIPEERVPGQGGDAELDWPEYFSPTPDDKMKSVQTLQLAVVSKIISQRSASEEISDLYKRDPAEEWKRLQAEGDVQAAELGAMFPASSEVGERDELPPGAEEVAQPSAIGGIEIPPSEMISVVRVDELRRSIGLFPIGGADGQLTIAQFKAKGKAEGESFGKAIGDAGGKTTAALDPNVLEAIASPDKPFGSAASGGKAPVTPTDAAKIVKVDEARRALNLEPLGPPDGDLTVAEYAAKREAQATEAGRLVGQAEGQIEAQQELAGEAPVVE